MRDWRTIGCLFLLGCVAAGCEGPPQVQEVDYMDVFAPQGALKLQGSSRPDGVQARVFLYRGSDAQTVIGTGNLELMLFEGKRMNINLAKEPPFKTWTYTPEELSKVRGKVLGLWCYPLALFWGETTPKTPTVTLVARYMNPSGRSVVSKPVLIDIH